MMVSIPLLLAVITCDACHEHDTCGRRSCWAYLYLMCGILKCELLEVMVVHLLAACSCCCIAVFLPLLLYTR